MQPTNDNQSAPMNAATAPVIPAPVPSPSPTPSPSPAPASAGDKKVGPIIASLIIVLILIIAALYIFATRINHQPLPDDADGAAMMQDESVQPVTNQSDDVESIQADLDASINGLDNQNF